VAKITPQHILARSDISLATRFLNVLLPNNKDQVILSQLFYESIWTAHQQAPASWEVTLAKNGIFLNVGQVRVIGIQKGEVVYYFLGRIEKNTSIQIQLHKRIYDAVPHEGGVSWLKFTDRIPEELKKAHKRIIISAATYKTLSPFRRSHSPAILKVFEKLLSKSLPTPNYHVFPKQKSKSVQVGAGFGNSENNRIVEQKAISLVTNFLVKEAWTVKSVEAEKIGYDLECKKGKQKLCVEVKGVSGSLLDFIITRNEYDHMHENDKTQIAVVTNTLTKDFKIKFITSAKFLQNYIVEPIQYKAIYNKK
jgi:CRISPR/Cas system-associated protein endoribonuclease Cas2